MIDEDYALLLSAVDELERYLLSNELYWPLFIHPKMKSVNPRSRLTPGNLLLSIQRLSSASLEEERKIQVQSSLAAFEATRQTWKSHWLKKCLVEFDARMTLWMAYLQDLLSERDAHAINFTYALRWRVILQLLIKEGIKLDESSIITLQALDENLKAVTVPNEFVWCMNCQAAFPQDNFWFLYRKLKP